MIQSQRILRLEALSSTDNVDLYKNTYALPLGFLVSDSLEADWDLTADDPGINWNNLVHSLGIADDLFVSLDVTNNGTTSVNVTTTERRLLLLLFC